MAGPIGGAAFRVSLMRFARYTSSSMKSSKSSLLPAMSAMWVARANSESTRKGLCVMAKWSLI